MQAFPRKIRATTGDSAPIKISPTREWLAAGRGRIRVAGSIAAGIDRARLLVSYPGLTAGMLDLAVLYAQAIRCEGVRRGQVTCGRAEVCR